MKKAALYAQNPAKILAGLILLGFGALFLGCSTAPLNTQTAFTSALVSSPTQSPSVSATEPPGRVTAQANISPLTSNDLLKAFRGRSAYSVFIPTIVPENITSARITDVTAANPVFIIRYYGGDHRETLVVLNGPAGCCLDSDPRKSGLLVRLANGISGHFLGGIQPEYGGPILWWVQDRTYVAVSGSDLTQEILLGVANSMSNSAALPLYSKMKP